MTDPDSNAPPTWLTILTCAAPPLALIWAGHDPKGVLVGLSPLIGVVAVLLAYLLWVVWVELVMPVSKAYWRYRRARRTDRVQ